MANFLLGRHNPGQTIFIVIHISTLVRIHRFLPVVIYTRAKSSTRLYIDIFVNLRLWNDGFTVYNAITLYSERFVWEISVQSKVKLFTRSLITTGKRLWIRTIIDWLNTHSKKNIFLVNPIMKLSIGWWLLPMPYLPIFSESGRFFPKYLLACF